jgi:hypothetical protein
MSAPALLVVGTVAVTVRLAEARASIVSVAGVTLKPAPSAATETDVAVDPLFVRVSERVAAAVPQGTAPKSMGAEGIERAGPGFTLASTRPASAGGEVGGSRLPPSLPSPNETSPLVGQPVRAPNDAAKSNATGVERARVRMSRSA